jgi:hypothetical protein
MEVEVRNRLGRVEMERGIVIVKEDSKHRGESP